MSNSHFPQPLPPPTNLFYNTLGGFIGGLVYWIGWKLQEVDQYYRPVSEEEYRKRVNKTTVWPDYHTEENK